MANKDRSGSEKKKKKDVPLDQRRAEKKQKRREKKHELDVIKRKSQRRHSTPKPTG
jgi:hypothetical protein